MPTYTEDQLTREAQLLLNELAAIIDAAMDEGAGIRALGVTSESDYAQGRHPDYLYDMSQFAVWRDIKTVEVYVREARAEADLSSSLFQLTRIVERVFSPAVIAELEFEKHNSPEWSEVAIPGPFETGAGDVPLGFFYNGILPTLVTLGQARMKMDRGERMTLAEIALLLDVPEQTVITNAHRKKFATVEDGNRRYAEPTDALPWMVKHGYMPTDAGAVRPATPKSDVPQTDLVFVPVAKDGSWFSPQAQRAGRYVIGAKGAEISTDDYFAALAQLSQMDIPRWRRVNAEGNAGIVTGVRFDRVSRAELHQGLTDLLPSA